jgi:hypothetical protein
MSDELLAIPWQGIPVSLFGVSPSPSFNKIQDKQPWSRLQIEILEKILCSHKRFFAKPVTCRLQSLTYNDYARVDLEALLAYDDPELEEDVPNENVAESEVVDREEEEAEPNGKDYVAPRLSVQYEFYLQAKLAGYAFIPFNFNAFDF